MIEVLDMRNATEEEIRKYEKKCQELDQQTEEQKQAWKEEHPDLQPPEWQQRMMDKNRVGYLTAEEKEREDQEQIEYLRKWKEKREKKREHRRKVKLYDRLFVGRKRRNTLSVPECRIREKSSR